MGNDKAPNINTRRYSTTTEKSIPVIIDSPEEKSDEKLINKTETIHEDANELIKNVNISEIENTTEGLQIKDEVKQNLENPLESHFEQEPVTYESVIEEDKTENPSDELSSDKEALDDIHTRRMMNARNWNEDENAHDENDFKKVLVWKNDDDVLLDVKGRSDKDNDEQVAIAKAEIKSKLEVTTPANFNIYGNNMNHPVSIQQPQQHPSVIQSKCLQSPGLNDVSSYERSNLENTYHLSRDHFPPQIPLQSAEEPVVSIQPQGDNFNLFSNAYPYTPTIVKTTLDDPTGNSVSTIFSKLIDASDHSKISQKLLNTNPYNRMYFNNYEPRNSLLPKYNVYNYMNRYRRYAKCCRY
ncbi:uncharacterized protein LOC125073992 [Vanessa atalanta]|uniref:uncharacterized protein LOC125073992 n=1 Tax=Vanessa atalanta TaxID=42275 RepID=UPI001FCE25CC|nr:uncharacterized protein LOC125073992 [Vanessa atalanta]